MQSTIQNLKYHLVFVDIQSHRNPNRDYLGQPFDFDNDKKEEIDIVEKFCESKNIPVALVDVWQKGGEGGIELAGKLINLIHNK